MISSLTVASLLHVVIDGGPDATMARDDLATRRSLGDPDATALMTDREWNLLVTVTDDPKGLDANESQVYGSWYVTGWRSPEAGGQPPAVAWLGHAYMAGLRARRAQAGG